MPSWVLAENVPGLLSLTSGLLFDHMLDELEASGFEIGPPLLIPASGVGANHRRERVFIVAHSTGERSRRRPETVCQADGRQNGEMCGEFVCSGENVAHARLFGQKKRQEQTAGIKQSGQDVADTDRNNGHRGCGTLQMGRGGSASETEKDCQPKNTQRSLESRVGDLADGFSHWLVEPDIPRVARGVKDRVNKLRALGNAVVPAQIYPILQAIAEVER